MLIIMSYDGIDSVMKNFLLLQTPQQITTSYKH